ncbi:DNA polymerase III, beta subunit [Thiovulum sp. ES]|nr:DNA polymerase III, beta subunit [Thiovulum sp. ES]
MQTKIEHGIMIEKSGKVLVNGVEFINMLKALKRENVVLQKMSSFLQIRQGKTVLSVKTIAGQDLPKFPTKEEKSSIKFDGAVLKDAFSKIAVAIDSNSPKYEITGGLISISNDGVKFVSTDTKRLIFVEESGSFENIEELEMILPKTAIIEIPKLFGGNIEFFYDSDSLVIENENLYFFTRLINGKYPNWKRIVPETFNSEYKFSIKNSIESVKTISMIAPEISVEMNGENVILETLEDGSSKTKGSTEFEVDFEFEEPIRVGLNTKFILDAFSVFRGDEVHFGFNESNRPFLLTEGNTKVVVMPINL